MRVILILIAVVATAVASGPAAAAAAEAPIGDRPAGRYIVVLDAEEGSPDGAVAIARDLGVDVALVYRNALVGYAGVFTRDAINRVERDPAVAYVVADTLGGVATVPQPNPPWGLDRIDQRYRPLNQTYNFDTTGAGVTAYVIDTGIDPTHSEFAGRAVPGHDIYGGTGLDCNGHGTHVAGTIGGTTYGVAKTVALVGVRVFSNCSGSGWASEAAAGVDWVTGNHVAGVPAVANMSLQYPANTALDDAVRRSIADGIVYAVAAGNFASDACSISPARVTSAITAGATSSNDARASFSNYGSCVDWYAPGDGILSSYIGTPIATAVLSGTSMASPHNAGAAARILELSPTSTPAQVRSTLATLRTRDVVTGAMSTANDDMLYVPQAGSLSICLTCL